jgi:hypothetical protein
MSYGVSSSSEESWNEGHALHAQEAREDSRWWNRNALCELLEGQPSWLPSQSSQPQAAWHGTSRIALRPHEARSRSRFRDGPSLREVRTLGPNLST